MISNCLWCILRVEKSVYVPITDSNDIIHFLGACTVRPRRRLDDLLIKFALGHHIWLLKFSRHSF